MTARPLLTEATRELMTRAAVLRDQAFGTRTTYSPKVFIPLTMLCNDRCGYCTFAQPPARLDAPFMTPDEVLKVARAGARARPVEMQLSRSDRGLTGTLTVTLGESP